MFVFINSGLLTCTSDQEWTPVQPMSEPATTTSIAKTCSHRRQFVSDPIAVTSCSAVAENDEAACNLKPECQLRTSMCQFDKLWISVKSL